MHEFIAPAVLALSLYGCVSQIPPVREFADHTVGSPIENLFERVQRPRSYVARTGGQIRQFKLDNGNSEYVEPIREGCLVHWEVNSSGIIVGYRTEGSQCY